MDSAGCQQPAYGGAVVCLLEGRERTREGGRGQARERERKLFSFKEREEACAGVATMQVNALANCTNLN